MEKHTVVIGASLNPQRYSHRAIIRLNSHNIPVIAVGLKEGTVGTTEIISFDSAFAKAQTHKNLVDTVTLYLNPKRQAAYYEYIISLSPKRVIFNPGTENPAFYKLLKEANITSEIACTLVLLATNQY